jgi:hypothetical protein
MFFNRWFKIFWKITKFNFNLILKKISPVSFNCLCKKSKIIIKLGTSDGLSKVFALKWYSGKIMTKILKWSYVLKLQ